MRTLFLGIVLSALAAAQNPPAAPSLALKVGDAAPAFSLPSTDGGTVNLTDFKGKKNVVLAFFPAAFTGGCTSEMQAYQLNLSRFQDAETQVFGISTDNTPSQREFAAKLKLTFPLLSDFLDRKVATAYGVLNPEHGIANRVTFVVGKDGKIAYIEQGKAAIDMTGTGEACSRLAHRTS